jgi:hypothetical protein
LTRNEFRDPDTVLDPSVPDPVEYLGYNIGIPGCLGILIALSIFFRLISLFFLKALVRKF